ncbi:hypothetical protein GCM10023317_96080 [Actinopolymorpha pittospori]|uniref:Uncharacterized protein n=1 Tax=Actinopolymorpha pittospori TaxID=648752 RepID=A0A927RAX4_9ACTN|nr:hypothetical protein [Actinopolymorpha pittospori]
MRAASGSQAESGGAGIEEIVDDLGDRLGRVYPKRSEPLITFIRSCVPLKDESECLRCTTKGVTGTLSQPAANRLRVDEGR